MTTWEIVYAISRKFNYRQNLIVPNISWGFFIHECDVFIVTKSGYAIEVEIKITKSDLIKDKRKTHGHRSNKIKRLYFAIPEKMIKHIEHIPQRAGIITVNPHGRCTVIRKPVINTNAIKLTDQEKFMVARLGALRIWGLQQTNYMLKKKVKELTTKINNIEKNK